jgi:hypothetical protein
MTHAVFSATLKANYIGQLSAVCENILVRELVIWVVMFDKKNRARQSRETISKYTQQPFYNHNVYLNFV